MRCVESLRGEKRRLPSLRVIVVDGGSADDSAAQLDQFTSATDFRHWVSFLPLSINGGFGWANNQAILALSRHATPPEFIHLLNPDTEVTDGAVDALVSELKTSPITGAVGSQLLTSRGEKAASAFRFPSPGRELLGGAQSEQLGRLLGIGSTVISSEEPCDVDWVTGASVMFRAEALRQIGLFDDGFFLYFEEVELMHRLQARGWRVRHIPASRVVHVEGASTGIGAATAERPHPAYWYDSRRRYFGLTGGTSALVAANLGLFGGKSISSLKKLVGRSPATEACHMEGVLAGGFVPGKRDLLPSVPAWGDPPGRRPAWMERA